MVTTNMPIMRAMRFHEYGGLDVLKYEDVARPEPQPGEVLVQVRAAAVNPFDLALREEWLASMIPLQLPAIVGVDVAGIVRVTGTGVTDFSIGQDEYGFLSGHSGFPHCSFPSYLERISQVANTGQASGFQAFP